MPTTLTDSNVKALRPRTSAYFAYDSQAIGLALKVTPPGRKIWLVQLTFPGQAVQSKRTLGHWPAMALEEARSLARQWRDSVRVGIDPKRVEAQQRDAAELARQSTFASVAEAFIASRTGKHRRAERDAKDIRRMLVKPWGHRPVSSLTPRDVRELIGGLGKRTVHGASAAWGHATLIFKYAVHEELITASPCASLDKKLVIGGKAEPRKRVLSDDEIVALWRASHRLEYPEGHLYRWLLLTGCRLSEASGASWTEFNFQRNTWTIPAERFKSGETHVLPLTDLMLALLASISRRGDWVFSHDGERAMNGFSKLKAKVDELTGDVPPWVNHDLRRTVRTNLAALNVADHVAEAVIGHGRKGIARVYDVYKYQPQIKAALTAWHARLAELGCTSS